MARKKCLFFIYYFCSHLPGQSAVTQYQQDHKPKPNTGSGITWQYLVISGSYCDFDYVLEINEINHEMGKIW